MTGRALARKLKFTPSAEEDLGGVPAKALKQVRRILGLMQTNLEHPSLKTHKFQSFSGDNPTGQPVFEAYAQNRTPGAYRVLFTYGDDFVNGRRIPILWIVAIVKHP